MISILCPCYNEEAVLPLFFQSITSVMEGIGEDFEIVCVNDGSHDGTLPLLLERAEKEGRICVVDLSREALEVFAHRCFAYLFLVKYANLF